MKIFVSGHLHMDYIYRHVFEDHAIIDIQVPCLKHYPVGYRMLTLHADDTLDVETRQARALKKEMLARIREVTRDR